MSENPYQSPQAEGKEEPDAILCPYCEDDYVWQVHLTKQNGWECYVFMCPECDNFWLNENEINKRKGMGAEAFAASTGQTHRLTPATKIRLARRDVSGPATH